MAINWQNTSALSGFQNALALGADIGGAIKQGRERSALAAYAAKPSEETAGALFPLKPELALRLQEHERQVRFGDAAARFMGRGGAALGGLGQTPGQTPGTMPTRVDQMDPTLSPGGGIGGGQKPQQNPDFSVFGQPTSEADTAFLDMLKQDPKAAFSIDSAMRDRAADRFKIARDAYGTAVSRLAGVQDQEGYAAALAEVQQQIAPLGINVTDHLPPQYPGVEGLRDLRLKAMDAKEQLTYFLQENNIDADNDRQDRNTESLITDRTERRAEQRRYNEGRLDVSRERVDVYRSKSAQGGRAAGGRSGGGNRPAAPVKINTPAEAMKLPKGTRYTTPDGKVMVR